MIPKKIHYIWFGGNPLTPLAEKCIASWKRFCPDYEIIRWDETNLDVRSNRYCRKAIETGKWAFASDYARLWVLVHEGGIYMDTDVQVLKPLDRFLSEEAVLGFETEERISTGFMAAEAGQGFFVKLLRSYNDRSFMRPDGGLDLTTNVKVVTQACLEEGLLLDGRQQTVCGVTVYPVDYFSPKDWLTKEVALTEHSYAIHHFDGSWADGKTKLKHKVMRVLGPKGVKKVKGWLGW